MSVMLPAVFPVILPSIVLTATAFTACSNSNSPSAFSPQRASNSELSVTGILTPPINNDQSDEDEPPAEWLASGDLGNLVSSSSLRFLLKESAAAAISEKCLSDGEAWFSSPQIMHELNERGEFEFETDSNSIQSLLKGLDADPDCAFPGWTSSEDFQKIEMITAIETNKQLCSIFCENSQSRRDSCETRCENSIALAAKQEVDPAQLAKAQESGSPLFMRQELNSFLPEQGPEVEREDERETEEEQTPENRNGSPSLPDLTLNGERARESVLFTRETFAEDSCVVVEGCIDQPGNRRLMRFDTEIQNIGRGDFKLGDLSGIPEEIREHSACHGHTHILGVMSYELLSQEGETVMEGQRRVVEVKQAFCLRDNERLIGNRPGKYDCEFQGITAGWSDIYDRSLDCQWLDITGVPAGEYRFRLYVNSAANFEESDYTNNAVELKINIPEESSQ